MKLPGRLFLLKVSDGGNPPAFVTIAGQRVTSSTIGVSPIDATTKDGSRWRELLEGGERSMEIASKGLLEDAAAHKLITQLAATGEIRDYELVFSNGLRIQRPFLLETMAISGDYREAQQYEITLQSADTIELELDALLLIEGGEPLLLTEGGDALLLVEES